MKQKIFAFVKSSFSDANGTGSSSRLLGGAIVAFTLAWVTYIVLRTTALPDLSGASLFVSAGYSAYAANKISDVFKGTDGKANDSGSGKTD